MAKVKEIARVRALVRSGAARSIRIAAGISQAELATEIGCSGASVCRWENGDRLPGGRLAVRYGKILDDLLGASR